MDKKDCNHCWHLHKGPLMMVIKEGHVVQSCCKCQNMRQVHRAHAGGGGVRHRIETRTREDWRRG